MLYIIEKDKDAEKNKDYVGDGLSANGIHIGKVRITYYFEDVLNLCKNKDVNSLYNIFSYETKINNDNLLTDIRNLYSTHDFDYDV